MPFASIQNFAKDRVAAVQAYSSMSGSAVANIFSAPRYWPDIFTQMDSIGVGSLPIVVLTGFFTGCVLALQSATSLKEFGAVSHDRDPRRALHGEGTRPGPHRPDGGRAATPPAWPPSSAP